MIFKSREDVFSGEGFFYVRTWIREALESWFATGEGASYAPFEECYGMLMEPSEVLAAVYHSLSEEKRASDNRSETGLFREATADLILEPAVFLQAPKIFREILRLGRTIGFSEVVESLSKLAQSNNLNGELTVYDENGRPSFYDLLGEAIDTVSQGRFVNPYALKFFKSVAVHLKSNIHHAPNVLENLVKLDPENWHVYANFLAIPLNAYKVSKISDPDFEYAVDMIPSSILKIVGPDQYQKGAHELKIGPQADSLNWLLPIPVTPTREEVSSEVRRIGPRKGKRSFRILAARFAQQRTSMNMLFRRKAYRISEEAVGEILNDEYEEREAEAVQ